MIEELATDQLIERGREEYLRDAYPTALLYLREAVKREPGYADAHNLIGLCLSLLGELEDAVGAFDRAIEINPRYVEALINRSLTLQELGRYDEARKSFEAAAAADVGEGDGQFTSILSARLANQHRDLGDLYAAGGALSEAADQYRRALQLRPRFADIRNRLGRALIELDDYPAAIRELEAALEVNPGFLEARTNLGLALFRMGSHTAAAREWQRVHEADPKNAQVRAYLAMVERK